MHKLQVSCVKSLVCKPTRGGPRKHSEPWTHPRRRLELPRGLGKEKDDIASFSGAWQSLGGVAGYGETVHEKEALRLDFQRLRHPQGGGARKAPHKQETGSTTHLSSLSDKGKAEVQVLLQTTERRGRRGGLAEGSPS